MMPPRIICACLFYYNVGLICLDDLLARVFPRLSIGVVVGNIRRILKWCRMGRQGKERGGLGRKGLCFRVTVNGNERSHCPTVYTSPPRVPYLSLPSLHLLLDVARRSSSLPFRALFILFFLLSLVPILFLVLSPEVIRI